MTGIPSSKRPVDVAVVGAGPSGMYVAQALTEQDRHPVRVDVMDRLPTPYGLIRYGVAPDHVRMKAVAKALARTFDDPRVRFLGDVEVGRSLSAQDLRQYYDAVVYCTGASAERTLGIPGEELAGSISAGQLVSWYNGHPDASLPHALQSSTAVVVGAGNVALDIARMLLLPAEVLRASDVPVQVLRVFEGSAVREVHVVARRGPEHVKFTPKELRDVGKMGGVDVVVDEADVHDADDGAAHPSQSRTAVFREWASRETSGGGRRVVLHFWTTPVELLGPDRVRAVVLRQARESQHHVLEAGLVVRCIGYLPTPPAGLPFDAERGCVPHLAGRVLEPTGGVRAREYVAGWLKRGPSGVIGTNKPDAEETVASLLDDLDRSVAGPARTAGTVDDLIARRGITVVSYDGWLAIDRAETEEGQLDGRGRVKIADWQRLREASARSGSPVAGRATHVSATEPTTR